MFVVYCLHESLRCRFAVLAKLEPACNIKIRSIFTHRGANLLSLRNIHRQYIDRQAKRGLTQVNKHLKRVLIQDQPSERVSKFLTTSHRTAIYVELVTLVHLSNLRNFYSIYVLVLSSPKRCLGRRDSEGVPNGARAGQPASELP